MDAPWKHLSLLRRYCHGRRMELDLVSFLRPTVRMAGIDEVKAQVERDLEEAKKLLSPL